MLSQERRMERYSAIYVWKILEGIVPNCCMEISHSERRGREVSVPDLKGSQRIQSLRENSFQVRGARIFNSLPKSLRNLQQSSVDEFKLKLDKYLENIPDEPSLPNYIPTACNSAHCQTINLHCGPRQTENKKTWLKMTNAWGVIQPPFVKT